MRTVSVDMCLGLGLVTKDAFGSSRLRCQRFSFGQVRGVVHPVIELLDKATTIAWSKTSWRG